MIRRRGDVTMDLEFGQLFYEGELDKDHKGVGAFIIAGLCFIVALFISFNAPFIFFGILFMALGILFNRFLPKKIIFIFERAIVINGLWYEEIYPRQAIERIDIKELRSRHHKTDVVYYRPYIILKESKKEIPIHKHFNDTTDEVFSRIIRTYVTSKKVSA